MFTKPHHKTNLKFLFHFLKTKNLDVSELKKKSRCFCLWSHSHTKLGLDALQFRELHETYYVIILIIKNQESLKLDYLSSFCFCKGTSFLSKYF